MKILSIEDSATQRDILQDFLSKNGLNAITAENGRDGIKKFQENEIDLTMEVIIEGLKSFSLYPVFACNLHTSIKVSNPEKYLRRERCLRKN